MLQVTIPNPLISFVMPVDVGDVITTSPAYNPANRQDYKVRDRWEPQAGATCHLQQQVLLQVCQLSDAFP